MVPGFLPLYSLIIVLMSVKGLKIHVYMFCLNSILLLCSCTEILTELVAWPITYSQVKATKSTSLHIHARAYGYARTCVSNEANLEPLTCEDESIICEGFFVFQFTLRQFTNQETWLLLSIVPSTSSSRIQVGFTIISPMCGSREGGQWARTPPPEKSQKHRVS